MGIKLAFALSASVFLAATPAGAVIDPAAGERLTAQVNTFLATAGADATTSSLAVRIHSITESSNERCDIIRQALARSAAPANTPADEALRLVRDLYVDCGSTAANGSYGTGNVPLTTAPGFAVGAGTANYQ